MVFFFFFSKYKKCLPVIYDIPWLVAKMAFYRPRGCCWINYFQSPFCLPFENRIWESKPRKENRSVGSMKPVPHPPPQKGRNSLSWFLNRSVLDSAREFKSARREGKHGALFWKPTEHRVGARETVTPVTCCPLLPGSSCLLLCQTFSLELSLPHPFR